jgi:hypothetical protein
VEDSWDADDSSSSSRGESSQLFLYDLMSPAAAEAAAAAGKAASGASSNSKLSLLLGDTYHGSIPATDATLSAGGSPLASADEVFGTQQQRHKRQQRNKQQQQRGQQGWGAPFEGADSPVVPLPDAAALQRSLRSMAPFGRPSPTSSSTSSSSRQVGRTSSSSSASSASEDSDWLTAVLSAPTSRLSSHSNTVLTNSLRRLASLRQAAGIGLGGAAAAAAAAADADEGLRGLLDSIRSRFGTFQLQQFEEVALQLAQLGYQPNAEWLAAFERWVWWVGWVRSWLG